MRLINVDEVKNSLLIELLGGVDGGTDASYLKTYEVIDRIEKIVNEWVDNQPTVKAIPIEFINRLIEKFDCERGNAIKDTFAHILTGLLEFWEFEQEKENEKSSISD